MGRIALAAKITHVPSLMLSERPGPLFGQRAQAIASLKVIGRRARERDVDTFIVLDTHWISNFGFHMNAKAQHRGIYTSHEAPHMIQDLAYDLPGNSDLGDRIAAVAGARGIQVLAHKVETLPLEYGTIVPMHYMNADGGLNVLPVASTVFATIEENRRFGAALREAVESSDCNVAVIASGSLSHKLVTNAAVGDDQWLATPNEFNRQMDLRVVDLWQAGRYREFVAMLFDYSTKCNGEAMMRDTQILFGALGWDAYCGRTEILCDYFPSSGSGQITAEFHT